ncbi:hypothetical protein ACNQGJ_14160 [Flavobacterium sp. GT2P42]|uniref:hypothetical protein n=1 Tax=Flavobacterium sp. GT2P42 TaxID=3401732 RepID=UPI003AAE182F
MLLLIMISAQRTSFKLKLQKPYSEYRLHNESELGLTLEKEIVDNNSNFIKPINHKNLGTMPICL